MIKLRHGSTRTVALFRGIAIKIPRMTTWRTFLNGLLSNMQEREFSRSGWPELCPILFSLPGGWLVIMKRAKPLSDDEWCSFDVYKWPAHDEYTVPVEIKQDSFGVLQDRIVAVDYGS